MLQFPHYSRDEDFLVMHGTNRKHLEICLEDRIDWRDETYNAFSSLNENGGVFFAPVAGWPLDCAVSTSVEYESEPIVLVTSNFRLGSKMRWNHRFPMVYAPIPHSDYEVLDVPLTQVRGEIVADKELFKQQLVDLVHRVDWLPEIRDADRIMKRY